MLYEVITVLATVELDADRHRVQIVTELQGRLLGATSDEAEGAVDAVVRALASTLVRRAARAARAGKCRRETPGAMRLDDGVLVEGGVDAAFLEEGPVWTVVDFKTDVELAARLEEYKRQVRNNFV